MVDIKEAKVDLMEKVADLIVLCNRREDLSGKIKIKEIGSYNVVVADTSSNGSGDTCTTN